MAYSGLSKTFDSKDRYNFFLAFDTSTIESPCVRFTRAFTDFGAGATEALV